MWHSAIPEARGRFEESTREIELAHTLDPQSLLVRVSEGENFCLARRYDQAIQSLNRTPEMEPNYWYAHFFRGLAYEQKEMFPEAISDLERAMRLNNCALSLGGLGHAYALSGRRREARNILLSMDKRAKHEYVDPLSKALIYAGLGDRDQAFRRLEEAYQQRSTYVLVLKVFPTFDGLHSDPRFTEMVHRAESARRKVLRKKPGPELGGRCGTVCKDWDYCRA